MNSEAGFYGLEMFGGSQSFYLSFPHSSFMGVYLDLDNDQTSLHFRHIPHAANSVPVSIKSFIVAVGFSQHVGDLSSSVHFESTYLSFKYLLLTSLLPQVLSADRAMIRAENLIEGDLEAIDIHQCANTCRSEHDRRRDPPLRMGTTNTSVTTSNRSLAWYFV